jgi:hypothetical protein
MRLKSEFKEEVKQFTAVTRTLSQWQMAARTKNAWRSVRPSSQFGNGATAT